jgi:hypothetical protein
MNKSAPLRLALTRHTPLTRHPEAEPDGGAYQD